MGSSSGRRGEDTHTRTHANTQTHTCTLPVHIPIYCTDKELVYTVLTAGRGGEGEGHMRWKATLCATTTYVCVCVCVCVCRFAWLETRITEEQDKARQLMWPSAFVTFR